MAKGFTDKYIQSLQPRPKKYLVREGRGFAVRVLPSGVKTFLYIYTLNGKRQELNLGIYLDAVKLAEARIASQDAYKLVSKGIDPKEHNKAIEEAKAKEEFSTFKHFCTEYMKYSKQHHSLAWHKTLDMSLKNDVLAVWGDKDIKDIRKRDVISLLEIVSKRSSGQVSNVHKAVRGVFEHAVQREYIEYNPALKLTKVVPALKGNRRDRILTEQEIKVIWNSLDDTPISIALKLILVTAQRPGEVSGIHTKELQDGEGKPLCSACRRCAWWTIPKERAEKGKGDHLVYLTPLAVKLIKDLREYADEQILNVKRNSISQVVSRAKYFGLPRWTPHDLRRTARTHMARIGIANEHAEAVLNHAKSGMVRVYNKYEYQEEKQDVLRKWEYELIRILS